MNKNRIWIVALVLALAMCLTLVLVACNNNDDGGNGNANQGEQGGSGEQGGAGETPAPTQEELFAIWALGRDFSMNYEGAFTTRYTSVNNDSHKKSKGENTESWGGDNKYFYVQNGYLMGENNEYQLVEELIESLRLVDENGTQITKMFYKTTKDGVTVENWDNQAEPDCRNAYFRLCPKSIVGDKENFIANGDTYETFIAAIKTAALDPEEGMGIEPTSITFIQNQDGSITFELRFAASREIEEEGCVMDITDRLLVTVKDGKVVEYASRATFDYKFEDETKNVSENMSQSYKFSYEFDSNMQKSIDTTVK